MAKDEARQLAAKAAVKDIVGQKKDTPLKYVELNEI